MVDLLTFPPGLAGFVTVFWQSGLFLAAGLAASLALRRSPARAHCVLLIAILGALVTPLCGQLAQSYGWGLRGRPAAAVRPSLAAPQRAGAGSARLVGPATGSPAPAPAAIATAAEQTAMGVGRSFRRRVDSRDRSGSQVMASIPLRIGLLSLWGVLSGACLARLIVSVIVTHRVVARARPIGCGSIGQAALAAATRLGLRVQPDLRASERAACPAIWCWGQRPVILLPETAVPITSKAEGSVEWVAVFCHELAHWVRRDHVSGWIAEILTCLLPWQPLAWWAKGRLSQLSELACDDWALSTGFVATDYAESLLRLMPQRRAAALAAVSSRGGLATRVRHILDERRARPAVGRRWAIASAAVMILAASAIALAQTRPAAIDDSKPMPDAKPAAALQSVPEIPTNVVKRRAVRGTVLGPGNKPIAGATVLWIAHRRPALPDVAMPKDHQAARSARVDVLDATRADAKGSFALAADFDPDRYVRHDGFDGNLLVKAPGMGMRAPLVKVGVTDVTLRLSPEVLIRGRLLAPGGIPASGARVTLQNFFNAEMTDGMGIDAATTDDLLPSYWPKPATTDADGRFTLEGMPEGAYATLDFRHPEYAVDEVTVNTGARGGIKAVLNAWVKAFEIAPVQPTFTHTLEPARPNTVRPEKCTGTFCAKDSIESWTTTCWNAAVANEE